jgi:carbamoyltransferase
MADLAASIQQHCERIALAYVRDHMRHCSKSSGTLRDVAIAGGLFANVRINQKLYEMDGVDRLWVHPGMSDMGLAVGAALALCVRNRNTGGNTGGTPVPQHMAQMAWDREVIRGVYYGPGYSAEEIERELERRDLGFTRPAEIEAEIARLLADGYVVARFNGRMEYGPRALGNRSILYQPTETSVNDWLNKRLRRTEFMPFAPSTLFEYAGECYRDHEGAQDAARFMTITFDCTDQMRKTCHGVVHVDGTARPQLVRKEENPSYYQIIDEFRRLTGVPTIINTSFNMHEEPIVCSPADAIRAFQLGHLDYLAIGDFLVPSPAPIDRELHPMCATALKQ